MPKHTASKEPPSQWYRGLVPSTDGRPDHPVRDLVLAIPEYFGQLFAIVNAAQSGLGSNPDAVRAGFALIFFSTIMLCVEDACSLFDGGATKKESGRLLRLAFIGTSITAVINGVALCAFCFLSLSTLLMYILGIVSCLLALVAPVFYIMFLMVNIFE